jgi:hypothetical protein
MARARIGFEETERRGLFVQPVSKASMPERLRLHDLFP